MKILNTHKFKIVFLGALFVVMTAVSLAYMGKSHSVSGQDEAPQLWQTRCEDKEDKGSCEIFQRLIVKETGQRVTEFAVGFPKDKKHARGAAILPLGVLLTDEITMKIDDGQSFSFKVRYCTKSGCFAFLNLNDKLLSMFEKGNEAMFSFKSLDGKLMSIQLSLAGFARALDDIKS